MHTKMKLSVVLTSLVITGPTIAENEAAWRQTDAENTVLMQLDEGLVAIELNPVFAPETVAQFRRLVRDGFYDGQSFYRVIDGFVAQGGDGSDMGVANAEPTIKAEFERKWSDQLAFVSVQKPDLFAPETGFVDGFPVARDLKSGKVWLTHCPGTVAMARLDDPDSSSTDFYIVIGQAPRYLDRNLTVFGRVVLGMDVVQRLRRGPAPKGGMIDDAKAWSTIKSVRIVSDILEDRRPIVQVIDTNSAEFKTTLDFRRNRDAEFFINTPPLVLDVCQVPNQGQIEEAQQ